MSSAIRTQVYRLLFIYVMLAALVVWQKHFIQVGIESNPYLNLLIIGVFLFGSLHAIISIVALGNEGRALAALREAYDDAVRSKELAAIDPLWRERRCFEPAVLFKRPRLLDSVYDLALDEIRRARTMRISVETMQTLLHTVDRRIVTDRALLGYLSGLCIFLGLIGTFIGLMEMVGSVGSIIGGVASADSGSPEAIKQLIRDLEAPLKGMATGFSASLFGLFSSLVLGLTARFSTQATNHLRNELEAWLGAMSRIETERETVEQIAGPGEDAIARVGSVALTVMGGMQRTGQLVGRAADAIRLLADRQSEQGAVLGRICVDLGTVARQNQELRETLERTTAVQQAVVETRSVIHQGFESLAQRIDGSAAGVAQAVAESRGQVVALVGAVADRQAEGLRQSIATGQRVDDALRRVELTQAGAIAEQQRSLAAVGSSLADLRGDVGDAGHRMVAAVAGVRDGVTALAGQLTVQTERQQRDHALLVAGLQGLDLRLTEHAGQRQAGEHAVQAGLQQLATTVSETAGALQVRADRQAEETRSVAGSVTTLHDLVGRLSGVLETNLSRQSGDQAEAAAAQGAALDTLSRHQAEIGRVLVAVADTLRDQRTGLDDELRSAIGAGFGQLSGALVQSQASLARALGEGLAASSPQAGLGDLAGTLRGELRDLRDALETSLASGFTDVSQSMTQTLEGLTRLTLAEGDSPAPSPHFDMPVRDEPAQQRKTHDIEALRRAAFAAGHARSA